jgi:hypothetical protein
MIIAFKARVNDPNIASYRYRVLAPIEALRARGHTVELFDERRVDRYDVVVFSKAFKRADQELAVALAKQGKRTLLDLCDNMFFNPRGVAKYETVREELLAMIAACDGVICSTSTLAEQIHQEAGLAHLPFVAPDPFDAAAVNVRQAPARGLAARLLWFGRHGSPNADAGMADLLLIREFLAEAHGKRPFELVICSDSREKYDELFADFPVPTRYLEWTPNVCEAELGKCDAVVLPLSDNPFVAAKTHNRLSHALSAGVPVVADAIESYREFAPFCYLDDWVEGLEAVLLHPEAARARAAGAGAYLELNWSKAAVASRWERALGLPERSLGASAASPYARALLTERLPAAPREAAAWIAAQGGTRAWLIAGAEANADKVEKARGEGFAILSVGRGFMHFRCDAALVTDLQTLRECGDQLERDVPIVIAPDYPLSNGWPSSRRLTAWLGQLPAMARLSDSHRLLAWREPSASLATMADPRGDEPALRLLTEAGVRMARYLGIPRARASVTGMEALAPFANRRTGGLAALRRSTGVSYGPYGYPVPARIFVGSDDEQLLGARLLEYSVEKYSTMDVKVEVLDFRHIPTPKDPKNRSRTGFSFCRFDIPRLCGYEGRGVYVDADMQVFTDITDLWTLPLDEADVLYALSHPSQGRTPQTSVMLMNCEALKWDVNEIIGGLDEGRYGYKDLMQKMCIHPAERVRPLLPYWWNSLERNEPGRTSLIHYTDMPTQPWVSRENKNGKLWYDAFAEALNEGFISEDEVARAVDQGHVSPRIYEWIGKPAPSSDVPVWVAPYHRFTKPGATVEGEVALTTDRRLRGWAYDPTAPDHRVRLGVFAQDDLLFEIQAEDYAEILERHGKGDGKHAFDVETPQKLWRSNVTNVTVRHLDSATELTGSPVDLPR